MFGFHCPCGYMFCRRSERSKDLSSRTRCKNASCQAAKRASETEKLTEERRKLDREYKAAIRTAETPQLTEKRKKLNRECTATTRAAETRDQRKKRRKSIQKSSAKTKQGPDYVCVSCHRLMYRQTVLPLNKIKYTKASESLLKKRLFVMILCMLVSMLTITCARLVIVL